MDFLMAHWLAILTFLIQCGFFKYLYAFLKQNKRQEKARAEELRKLEKARDQAIRCLLRSEIIGIYHKAEEKGFLPIYNLENLNDMYKSYKSLGGNGAIKDLYYQVKNYPHNNPQGD